MRRHARRRSGIAAVIALVMLTVLGLLMAEAARQTYMARRQLDQRECLVQARLWADSGLELATAGLRNDPAYRGETVTLPDGEIVVDVSADRIHVRATNSLRSAGPLTIERTSRRK